MCPLALELTIYTFTITETRLDGVVEETDVTFSDLDGFLTLFRPEFNRITNIVKLPAPVLDPLLAAEQLQNSANRLIAAHIPSIGDVTLASDPAMLEMIEIRLRANSAYTSTTDVMHALRAKFDSRYRKLVADRTQL